MLVPAIIVLLLGAPDSDVYAWPLDLPPELSSSFAEYRPGRFHAGIDLRTGGIGRAVRAPSDGEVTRLRCAPDGYGKAVYLHLNDGRNVVFGHLDDYDDALRNYVRQAQHAAKSYTVDLYPEPGRFPVSRGQIIAKSGQTGIGAPHLHYEIRDAAQQPVNPRVLGIGWPDSARPVINKVLIAPEGSEDRVNGDLLPVALDAKLQSAGRYTCAPIQARGRIGIGVDAVDPSGGGARLGVYRVRLLHDETELFRVQHDLLSYDNLRNGRVAYHPYFLGQGQFLLLWRWPGNVCPSYAHSPGDGWFEVPVESCELKVEVSDFLGNQAILSIPVQSDTFQSIPAAPPAASGHGTAELTCVGNYLLATACFDAVEAEAPSMEVKGGGVTTTPAMIRISGRLFHAAFIPSVSGQYAIQISHPRISPFARTIGAFKRDEGGWTVDLDAVQMRVFPGSPYGILFAWSETPDKLPATTIRRLGPVYGIAPAQAPIDTPIELSFPVPSGIEKYERVHVYRKYGTVWVWMDTKRETERLTITTRDLGTYAIMEDDKAPVVTPASPPAGYQAKNKRPRISATVTDAGSGIADITVTCGEQWLLTAYDPEHNRIEWERDADLPPGTQEITIRVTDKAGNVTIRKFAITVPG